MNKELLKLIWNTFGLVLLILLLVNTFYEWTQGKQPDNMVVMVILILTISLNKKM